jgi:hypothetical protein
MQGVKFATLELEKGLFKKKLKISGNHLVLPEYSFL